MWGETLLLYLAAAGAHGGAAWAVFVGARATATALAAIALAAHGGFAFAMATAHGAPVFGFDIALLSFLWITVVVGWAFFPLAGGVAGSVCALAAAGVLASPALRPAAPHLFDSGAPLLAAHLFLAAAVSAFAAASFLQLLWMRFYESRLRGNPGRAAAPPLLALEAACFRAVGAAFWLSLLTLATGAALAVAARAPIFDLTHKNLFAVLSAVIFGVLLIGRKARGWRGRAASRLLGAGFLLLGLSYLGSRFVLQILLER